MPQKVLSEERAQRRAALEQKRAARRAQKEQLEQQQQVQSNGREQPQQKQGELKGDTLGHSPLLELAPDALSLIYSFLSAAELGRLTLSCKALNLLLNQARVDYVLSRLWTHGPATGRVGYTHLCTCQTDARQLLQASNDAGGDTGRIVPRGKYAKQASNEFVGYARYLEQVVCGYGTLDTGSIEDPIFLPRFAQGRFVSVSPEHSLCRVGGDGSKSGPGGSGVATWGVGKRGQLGHGQRKDERHPRRLLGGIGYGIRIVQVSAGGGLVRVAHSLLLTSTGRVLSFGTGQYGALGHGYSQAKQLPDAVRPQYVDALAGVRCVCVAAGELHSAVVTSDGDVYTWGDGFCGQLGLGDKRPQPSPKQVTLGGLEDEVVASVSCGSRHTIAVTEDGEVFSWGLGHFGVLGRSFTPFDYDADAAVVAFTGGENDGQIAVAAPNGAPMQAAPPRVAELPARPDNPGAAAGGGERDYAAELMAHLDLIANLSLDDSSDQCYPKRIDSLQGVKIVGSSAGHRHSLLLSENGELYSCGAGSGGCLGHGDTLTQMHPMKVMEFEQIGVKIMQMSAGVDVSMAVSTTGDVFAWGKTDGGRIGLGLSRNQVTIPRRVSVTGPDGAPVKAVDVECGYVHSIIVGLTGTIYMCGGVGVEGEEDGQTHEEELESTIGRPRQVNNFNIWHRTPEPKEHVKKERWKKFGKYEVKGRTKMMSEP